MNIASARQLAINQIPTERKSEKDSFIAYVFDVILDTDSPFIDEFVEEQEPRSQYVGCILYKRQDDLTRSESEPEIAYPDINLKTLPLKNEVVRVYKNGRGQNVYERTGFSITPNVNSLTDTISSTFKKDESQIQKSSDYSKVSQTGISRTNSNNESKTDGYGQYFESNDTIHKLSFFEGDTLLESRFGQSIRFSAYNNSQNEFSPTIILRNGESPLTLNNENLGSDTTTILEDINRDGSVIVLGSGQYQLPFQPGTVNEGGSSDFQTKPKSFSNYPNNLLGNQILLNSDRIILSSKTGEMIFYSKKNYGFISDGTLSIDNKRGIEVNVGDDINVETNDFSINLNTGNGNVNIGDVDLESLVRGETLVDLLSQLIDAITQQIYLTPSGPTSAGPTNVATFTSIKNKLNTMLSELNKTS